MTTTARREDTKPARKLPWILEMYRSDVAKKWIMAVSGVILLGYIAAHMLGNMKLYFGAEEINHYGESLRDLGGDLVPRTHLLWIMRIGLTAAFAVHIHAAYSLTRPRACKFLRVNEYAACMWMAKAAVSPIRMIHRRWVRGTRSPPRSRSASP